MINLIWFPGGCRSRPMITEAVWDYISHSLSFPPLSPSLIALERAREESSILTTTDIVFNQIWQNVQMFKCQACKTRAIYANPLKAKINISTASTLSSPWPGIKDGLTEWEEATAGMRSCYRLTFSLFSWKCRIFWISKSKKKINYGREWNPSRDLTPLWWTQLCLLICVWKEMLDLPEQPWLWHSFLGETH